MRMGFGLIGLLLALVIVGVLVKKQMGATRMAVPVVPSVAGAPVPASGASAASVREQSQQVQQQVKQQMEALMQSPRPMPEDESK